MKTLSKVLAERNRRFQALPRNKKAIAVAKDVLKRIDTKQIKPRSGSLLKIHRTHLPYGNVYGTNYDLQSLVEKGAGCTACALGAAMCSIAHFRDEIKVDSDGRPFNRDGDEYVLPNSGKLKDVFGKDMPIIEYAFERGGSTITENWTFPGDMLNSAEGFGRKFRSDRDRLTAIMKNIIKNDGRFIP